MRRVGSVGQNGSEPLTVWRDDVEKRIYLDMCDPPHRTIIGEDHVRGLIYLLKDFLKEHGSPTQNLMDESRERIES